MRAPGGSRWGDLDRTPSKDLQEADPLGSCQSADPAGDGDARSYEGIGGRAGRHRAAIERDIPSGVWLGVRDGTVLFHPLGVGTQGVGLLSMPEPGAKEEDVDEATLDAASRLMPLLPRELIAEYLQLGPYRDGGGARPQ